jgi:hypothetical protein
MTIRVHVERLVLDGLPVTPADRERLASALVGELTERLGQSGTAPQRGASIHRLVASPIVVWPHDAPARLGSGIGRVVHSAMGGPLVGDASPEGARG